MGLLSLVLGFVVFGHIFGFVVFGVLGFYFVVFWVCSLWCLPGIVSCFLGLVLLLVLWICLRCLQWCLPSIVSCFMGIVDFFWVGYFYLFSGFVSDVSLVCGLGIAA